MSDRPRSIDSSPQLALSLLRTEYAREGLKESDLDPAPWGQLATWLTRAIDLGLPDPNAMTLATATKDGAPSARIVLLKELDERGLVFYTNYDSQKGQELEANPRAAALFFWPSLERQVRVTGAVEKVSHEQSEAYFHSRPIASQLGALASPQSRVVANREVIEARMAELAVEHRDKVVPLPPWWGGFRLVPTSFEFWQGRASRLHDRLRYARSPEGSWFVERLAP